MAQFVYPVVVSFHTPLWIQVALRSLHKHFPHWRILVVDNNPQPGETGYTRLVPVEREWLHKQPYVDVIEQREAPRNHGQGIDRAVAWCREQGVRWMLHLEPDCVVRGTEWYANLCRGIDRGALMAASHKKLYGPLHVTPSLWEISAEAPATMDYVKRGPDESHPRFHELFNLPWLLKEAPEATRHFWLSTWDTGQKAWFEAAIQDRAALVEETPDFEHFWFGSRAWTDPQDIRYHAELKQYVDPWYQPPVPGPDTPISCEAQLIHAVLIQKLSQFRGKKAALLGSAMHANTGDHVITLGTRAAFRQAGIELVAEQPGLSQNLDCCRQADIVFLAGGGNFGDLYRHEAEFRLAVTEQLTQPVVWLPQALFYRDLEVCRNDAARLAACPHAELWFRDAESLSIASKHFKNRTQLVPDMAFGLDVVPLQPNAAGPVVRILRRDAEQVDPGASTGIDWLLPGLRLLHDPDEVRPRIRQCMPDPSLVITDRLHVHILCVLADIPNVLVAGSYHKSSAFFRTWSHLHARSQLANTWDEAEDLFRNSRLFSNGEQVLAPGH